jgi:hypothetical protein
MLDFQAWIERTFSKWTYRQLSMAVLLIAAVIVSTEAYRALRAAPIALVPGATKPVVVKRWLTRDDPRGFLPAAALGNPGSDDKKFDIAWISGSPIAIAKAPPQWRLLGKPNYGMTDVLARYLVSMKGEPIRVQEFLLHGVRTGDMRRAVLFAAEQPEIDAYILEANTLWLVNDYLQFARSRQRALILGYEGTTPFDMSVAARLLRPHEVGLQLLSGVFPTVRDRYQIFNRVSLGGALSFPYSKRVKQPLDAAVLRNWWTWFTPEILSLPIAKPAQSFLGLRHVMLMSDLSSSGIGMRNFIENVKTLSSTGKPAVIYLPPLHPALRQDPVTVAYIERLTAALKAEFAKVAGPNVEFHSETVWDAPQPYEHIDILHMKHAQGVIDRMVSLLEKKIGTDFVKRPLDQVYTPPKTPAKTAPKK